KVWFKNATRSMTKEETKEVMGQITQRTKEREEIDTEAKEKVVDDLGGIMAEMSGKDGIQFEPVSGVGDEASFNLSDGGLSVRQGNLTFTVAPYHGEAAPTPNFKGVSPKEMAKVAMENNRE